MSRDRTKHRRRRCPNPERNRRNPRRSTRRRCWHRSCWPHPTIPGRTNQRRNWSRHRCPKPGRSQKPSLILTDRLMRTRFPKRCLGPTPIHFPTSRSRSTPRNCQRRCRIATRLIPKRRWCPSLTRWSRSCLTCRCSRSRKRNHLPIHWNQNSRPWSRSIRGRCRTSLHPTNRSGRTTHRRSRAIPTNRSRLNSRPMSQTDPMSR
jgi:hypothetical protein